MVLGWGRFRFLYLDFSLWGFGVGWFIFLVLAKGGLVKGGGF